MTDPSTNLSEGRRRDILEAATTLFVRYGYRRTSVDLIAREAQIAKGTLYAYFENKEAIFQAVCEIICARILADAEAAWRSPGRLEPRLLRMLAAKYTYLFELVHSSPHAAELLDSQNRLAADIVQKTDQAYRRLVTALVEVAAERGALDLRRVGLSPTSATDLLLRCAAGVQSDASSPPEHYKHLAQMLRALLLGLGAGLDQEL